MAEPDCTSAAGEQQDRTLLHFLLEGIPDRIYFKDEKSRFIRISRSMCGLFGLKNPEEARGKTDFDFFTAEHATPAFEDEREVMRSGHPIIGKIEKETLPDGRVGWALTTKLPLRDETGRIVGTCGISKDITALKAAEDALESERNRLSAVNAELQETMAKLKGAQARLVEAEKNQSIARLALGVAHEVKNPLAIMQMGLDYFSSQTEADSAGAEILQQMKTALWRADGIISELMAFSDSRELNLSPAALPEMIDRVLNHLDGILRQCNIRVVKGFDAGVPPVPVDAEKMEHVFTCLFDNAIDAMGAGGTLTIRTYLKELKDFEAMRDAGSRSHHRLRAGEQVAVLEVNDTGPGIPPLKLGNVYDPFFTSKETGKGTGLGLTVSKKIIELHGGLIDIVNQPGGGVRVMVSLKI